MSRLLWPLFLRSLGLVSLLSLTIGVAAAAYLLFLLFTCSEAVR
jgi:hypothetical protein